MANLALVPSWMTGVNANQPGLSSLILGASPRTSVRGTSQVPPGAESSWAMPSRPARRASRLIDPLLQVGSLRLLHAGHLDVPGPVGCSERGRELKVGTAVEDDIHGHVVGRDFNDPPKFWFPVKRPLPLDGVLEARDCRSDRLIQSIDDGLKIRHQAPAPIIDVGVVRRGLWRISPRISLDRLRNSASSSLNRQPGVLFYPQTCSGSTGCRFRGGTTQPVVPEMDNGSFATRRGPFGRCRELSDTWHSQCLRKQRRFSSHGWSSG